LPSTVNFVSLGRFRQSVVDVDFSEFLKCSQFTMCLGYPVHTRASVSAVFLSLYPAHQLSHMLCVLSLVLLFVRQIKLSWIKYQVEVAMWRLWGQDQTLTTLSSIQFNPIQCNHISWLGGSVVERRSLSDRRTFTGLHRTCSWWVTIYMGKLSAVGQPTRPTQPFIHHPHVVD